MEMLIRIVRTLPVLDRTLRRRIESTFRRLGGFLLAACVASAGIAGDALRTSGVDSTSAQTPTVKHVVLLGASIGRAWDIESLPSRVEGRGYRFEYVGVYSPDKGEALAGLLARRENKPDAIIIKECASYFPGSFAKLQNLVPAWVRSCREAGVEPILATAVPVVRSYPLRIFFLSLMHGRFEYPAHAFGEIIAYNDWVRAYARGEGLAVLDLEAAVRSGASNRRLKAVYAKRDGLHLNEKGYRALDAMVIPALEGTRSPAP